MSHKGDGHEQAAKKEAPKAAPERAARAPKLHSVACGVKADDLFVRVVSLPDNAEIFRLEARRDQFFHRRFG